MKSTIHIILKHNKRFNLSYMEEKDVLDQLEKNIIHAIPNMDSLFWYDITTIKPLGKLDPVFA